MFASQSDLVRIDLLIARWIGFSHAPPSPEVEKRWRRVNSPHLVALVQAGVKFHDGKTRILPDLPSDSVVNLQVDATLESAIHNI